MLRTFSLIAIVFSLSTHLMAISEFLDLPINLGMERAEVEEVLRSPLFSYAEDFKITVGKNSSTPTLAYALYSVPDWNTDVPRYVLTFFLDGYVTRLIGLYGDQVYQKVAWDIANKPGLQAGRYKTIEYYANSKYMAYYILQVIYPKDPNSILTPELQRLIFETTKMSSLNIIFYHDEEMFQLLYQSIQDLNLLSDIFRQLMAKPVKPSQERQPESIPEQENEGIDPFAFPEHGGTYPDGGESAPESVEP